VGIDTSTGELHQFKTKQLFDDARAKNEALVEIQQEVYQKMLPLAPAKRLAVFKSIAGPNKSKQRRAKKLAKRISEESRRRNRR
jgi:hypothetical protein